MSVPGMVPSATLISEGTDVKNYKVWLAFFIKNFLSEIDHNFEKSHGNKFLLLDIPNCCALVTTNFAWVQCTTHSCNTCNWIKQTFTSNHCNSWMICVYQESKLNWTIRVENIIFHTTFGEKSLTFYNTRLNQMVKLYLHVTLNLEKWS